MKKLIFLILLFFLFITSKAQTLFVPSGTGGIGNSSTSNIGIGLSNPSEKLHINGSIRGDQQGALRINSGNGYIDVGCRNTMFAHFYTDRTQYYFDKRILNGEGIFSSYGSADLQLCTGSYFTPRIYVSNSSGNVGIGTTTPSAKLQVIGSTLLNGKLGIGTNTLTGVANIYSSGTIGSGDNLNWAHSSLLINQDNVYLLGFDGNQIAASKEIFISSESDPGRIVFTTKYQGVTESRVTILGNKVGIGTINPQSMLTVNGEILCEKVRVIVDVPSADYVFEPDYKLKSLAEIETYIKNNKHLPEIPSSEEFKQNGYEIGSMDELLLKKIEEQMLYIIELNKKIIELEAEINIKK